MVGKMTGIFFVILLLAASPLLAQLPTATILGTVKDTSGGVVPGAAVTVRNLDQGLTRSGTTGPDGSYRFPVLPVGSYEVQVSSEGFKTATRTGVTLTVNQDAVLNFTLEVGSRTDTVQVAADAPVINTTNSSLGSLVNEQTIDELPLNGRNFVDLALLQPGVTKHGSQGYVAGQAGTVFTVNGAPTRSNNFLLDGAVMQNYYQMNSSSVSSTTLGAEGIREYQVVTNLFSAEYGLRMGSQTTMVSKSGTNAIHGSAFEYFRNEVLDARNYFDQLYSLPPDVPGGGKRIPPFKRNQFGASLGGPLKKDKTFLFGTYEGIREVLGNPPTANIANVFPKSCYDPTTKTLLATNNPCATLSGGNVASVMLPFLPLYPYPNLGDNQFTYLSFQRTSENYGLVRLDQNFSANDNFFARYTVDDTFQERPFPHPQRLDTWSDRKQYLTLAETHTFASALVNEARVSYSRTAITTTSFAGAGGPDLSFIPGRGIGDIGVGDIEQYGPDVSPGYHHQNIYTFSDDLFWTKGKHAFKFGTMINRFLLGFQEDFFGSGFSSFTSSPTFFAGIPFFYMASVASLDEANRYYRYNSFGFYAQDDYRVSGRLTLNLGLRYEFNTVPREKFDRDWRTLDINAAGTTADPAVAPSVGWTQGPVFQNPSLHNFSPRFGFAWDVLGTGKTAIRGGAGIYYDIGTFNGALVNHTIGTPPLTGTNFHFNFAGDPLPVPFTFGPADLSSGITTADYYSKQPYMVQYNLSIQQQLPGDMALNIGYVGSRGIHLWDERPPNPTKPLSITNGVPIFPVPGDPTCTPFGCPRINPKLGAVVVSATTADSFYNGLQATVSKRLSSGLQFQASYTWSKLLSTSETAMGNDTFAAGITNPFSTKTDYGPAVFDTAHNLEVSGIYRFPEPRSSNAAAKLLQGWFVGSILSVHSGYPVSPAISWDNANAGWGAILGGNRPSLVTSSNLQAARQIDPLAAVYNPDTVILGDPVQWFDPHMFTVAAPGHLGDTSRGMMRGPNLVGWDLSLNKDTRLDLLGETGSIQFRAEIFNILNRPNFGGPNPTVFTGGSGSPTALSPFAGNITTTSTISRQIQFALRVVF